MDIEVMLDDTGPVVTAPEVAQSEGRSGPVTRKGNPSHTPPRSIRVPDELWEASKHASLINGGTVTDVVNVALARYVLSQLEDGNLRRVDRKLLSRLTPEDELRRMITHIETSRPKIA